MFLQRSVWTVVTLFFQSHLFKYCSVCATQLIAWTVGVFTMLCHKLCLIVPVDKSTCYQYVKRCSMMFNESHQLIKIDQH